VMCRRHHTGSTQLHIRAFFGRRVCVLDMGNRRAHSSERVTQVRIGREDERSSRILLVESFLGALATSYAYFNKLGRREYGQDRVEEVVDRRAGELTRRTR